MVIIKCGFHSQSYRGAGAVETWSVFIVGRLKEKSEFLWKINRGIVEWFMLEGIQRFF